MSRRYWQLDVFAERPLTGNGLAVFDDASALDDAAMQAWTRELRQFESIFLLPGDDPRAFRARIFTLEEELPFAGHRCSAPPPCSITCAAATTNSTGRCTWPANRWPCAACGRAAVSTPRWTRPRRIRRHPGRRDLPLVRRSLSLSANDLSGHPPRVVSTGLPYLLLPVTAEALGRARQVNDLQEALDKLGAAFVICSTSTGARAAPGTAWGWWKTWLPAALPVRSPPTWWNTGLPRAANPSSCTRDASSSGRAGSTSRSRQTVASGSAATSTARPRRAADLGLTVGVALAADDDNTEEAKRTGEPPCSGAKDDAVTT